MVFSPRAKRVSANGGTRSAFPYVFEFSFIGSCLVGWCIIEHGCVQCPRVNPETTSNRNFLKFIQKWIEIIVFVAKSTNFDLEHLKLSSFVTVIWSWDCHLDISLYFYAHENFLLRSIRNWNYEKIWIVKGDEKGYVELLARLKLKYVNKFDFWFSTAPRRFATIFQTSLAYLASFYLRERRNHMSTAVCTECKKAIFC